MNTQIIMVSPQMEQIFKDIAACHDVDWTKPGAQLHLAIPGRAERWLLLNLDGKRFSVGSYLVEPNGILTPDVDMVFEMHAVGWEPIELLYSHEAFATFLQDAHEGQLPVFDADGNLYFDTFTEYWAEQLRAQGWVEHGQPVPDPKEGGRLVGCQSTNHTVCYGELWQCAVCGKTVCCNEGSDDHPDLCDDCWAVLFAGSNDVHFAQSRALQLVCDCPEQCGTVLKLSHDGFLVVEDRDGLQVTFMLPEWLDFAIRRVMLAHVSSQSSVGIGNLEDDVPF